MAYDYAGYGVGSGEPSEASIYADIEAAFAYLTTVIGALPETIILYGRSLGSGPTCYLAKKQREKGQHVAGVILQSPILSVYRVAFPFRFSMPGDLFCNIDKSPITIIHGTNDEVVPFWHGEELFSKCTPEWRSKPFWIPGGGHNNLELVMAPNEMFFKHLQEFIHLCHEALKYRKRNTSSTNQAQGKGEI